MSDEDPVWRTPWRTRLLRGSAVTGGVLAVAAALAYPAQRAILFPAPRPARRPDVAPDRLLTIAAGSPVHAIHFPAPDGAPTIVHFHGNGEQLADMVPLASVLRAAGLGVLAVEYPGYGLSAGTPPSEEALYASADVALAHLARDLAVPRERVVLSGHSLGTGVATEMAKRRRGARLVLTAPFTSVVDMAGALVPLVPARWLVRDRFDNLAKATSIDVPTLVIHGTDDELIPFDMGSKVARAIPRGRFLPVPAGHHNDLYATHGRAVIAAIIAFARSE